MMQLVEKQEAASQVAGQVGAVFDSLAVRLQVPASAVWEIFVRQAAVEFYVALVLTVGAALFTYLGWRVYDAGDRKDSEGVAVLGVGIGTAAAVCFTIGVLRKCVLDAKPVCL